MDKTLLLPSGDVHLIIPVGSQLTLEDTISGSLSVVRSVVLELQEGAKVTFKAQHELSEAAEISTMLTVILATGADFQATWNQSGGFKTTLIFECNLVGKLSQARFIGRLQGSKKEVHKATAVQNHQAADTESFFELKAVLADASELLYDGTITIAKQATRSSAFQEQKTIIIGDEAKVRSVPNLQVLTNDVQCGHGSAVSYVDEEHLFYLQSRGIKHEAARNMIIEGFLT